MERQGYGEGASKPLRLKRAVLVPGLQLRNGSRHHGAKRRQNEIRAMTERPRVLYAREPALDVAEFRRVLVESGLGALRPIEDESRLRTMLSNADLLLTARWDRPDNSLIGVARCITDFAWCCYVSELAVSATAQGHGVGKGLLDETRRQLGPGVSIMLASVSSAAGFYERNGMTRLPDVFWYRRER
jgi:GNAT superfamily N-acetyltransferase